MAAQNGRHRHMRGKQFVVCLLCITVLCVLFFSKRTDAATDGQEDIAFYASGTETEFILENMNGLETENAGADDEERLSGGMEDGSKLEDEHKADDDPNRELSDLEQGNNGDDTSNLEQKPNESEENSGTEGEATQDPDGNNPADSAEEDDPAAPPQEAQAVIDENAKIEDAPEELSEQDIQEVLQYIESRKMDVGQPFNMDLSGQEPAHRKYIKAKPDGTYSLTLEVTGDSKKVVYPADVVIMFDISSTTNDEMLESFKHAARTMADILLTPENESLDPSQQTRIAIITFNESARIHSGFTASRSQIERDISTIAVIPGYTNWAGAFTLADQVLGAQDSSRANARKYALFQTDGGPNRPDGSEAKSYNSGFRAASQLTGNGVTLYTLGVLDQDNVHGSVFMPYVRLAAPHPLTSTSDYSLSYKSGYVLAPEALTRHAYRSAGRGSEELGKFFIAEKSADNEYVQAFAQIAQEISGQVDFSDVVITDQLSEYATLLNNVGQNGEIENCIVEKTDGVTSRPVEHYTLRYDESSKTIYFSIDERLSYGMTYSLTFDISPSQKAFDDLAAYRSSQQNSAQNGYPHIGEAQTGGTSENQPGFFSNTEATLTYHITDEVDGIGPEQTASPFGKPVLQPELSILVVQKYWIQDSPSERPASVQIVLKQDGVIYRTQALNADNGWFAVFFDIPSGPQGHRYTLEEIQIPGYEAAWDRNEVELRGLKQQTAVFSLVNTRTKGTLRLEKVNTAQQGIAGAEFKLYEANPDGTMGTEVTGYQLVTAADGSCTLQQLPFGDYILVEIRAPYGYMLLKEPQRIEFRQDGQVVSLVNHTQYMLPAAGGRGTIRFAVMGGMLITAACYLLKKNKRDDPRKE